MDSSTVALYVSMLALGICIGDFVYNTKQRMLRRKRDKAFAKGIDEQRLNNEYGKSSIEFFDVAIPFPAVVCEMSNVYGRKCVLFKNHVEKGLPHRDAFNIPF